MTGPRPSLVLSGGNALGAYHLGAWRGFEAAGLEPGRIAGASIGAIMAAIIAGNAPGERSGALQKFWDRASMFDGLASYLPPSLRAPLQYAQAAASRLLGRTTLFTLRPADVTGTDRRPSVFDIGPMRDLVGDLVDFGRLNEGEMQVSVLAVDLETGSEVAFVNHRKPITLDHLMASAALIPDFPPVEIDGRLLVDGGLSANLPLDLVLDTAGPFSESEQVCFAVDLFPSAAPLPRGILQGAQRQTDLIFASQTKRTLARLQGQWIGREPGAHLFVMAAQATEEETALKGFDFSATSLMRRASQGERDMRSLVENWRLASNSKPGLTIHHLAR